MNCIKSFGVQQPETFRVFLALGVYAAQNRRSALTLQMESWSLGLAVSGVNRRHLGLRSIFPPNLYPL